MFPTIIVTGLLLSLIAGALLFAYRHNSTPPAAMFAEIRNAILQIQRAASENITPLEQANRITGIDETQMMRQTCHVRETIRYVYTIDESAEGIVHTISSQLIRTKSERYQVQCMLAAMLTLNEQLAAAGIDPKSVDFGIDRSATGTHYVGLQLTADQHQQMMARGSVRSGEIATL